MNKVYLMIGSNEGDRQLNLLKAKELLSMRIGEIISISSIYETESWGYKSKTNFYNQCIILESNFQAIIILKEILEIEQKMGRLRHSNYLSDRIIDIDILFYNDECINLKDLTIPHPRLAERKFVLIPLTEIAPHLIHPVLGKSIDTILMECKDKLMVKKLVIK